MEAHPFPLLELPREIRDEIYFYLCGDQTILVSKYRDPAPCAVTEIVSWTVLRGPPVQRRLEECCDVPSIVKDLPLVSF